jgi:hypothetical protein
MPPFAPPKGRSSNAVFHVIKLAKLHISAIAGDFARYMPSDKIETCTSMYDGLGWRRAGANQWRSTHVLLRKAQVNR